jgi:hypothetical protein
VADAPANPYESPVPGPEQPARWNLRDWLSAAWTFLMVSWSIVGAGLALTLPAPYRWPPWLGLSLLICLAALLVLTPLLGFVHIVVWLARILGRKGE